MYSISGHVVSYRDSCYNVDRAEPESMLRLGDNDQWKARQAIPLLRKCIWITLVYLFTRDYISDGFLVQDISSTVWTKVAEHLEKCMAMEKLWFRNYLKIMVRNTVVDHYREEKAIHELQKNIQDVSNSNCGYSIAECEEKEYLREAVTVLSDEDRQLLYFKYEMNMRSEEIGEALGISAGAVRMRHKRTVEKLRKEINRLRANDGDMPL